MRSYSQLIQRLNALSSVDLHIIGAVGEYPIHRISLPNASAKSPNILLTAGVHGDEPAGVETVLHLLESQECEILAPFSFTIVPCVNPSGYVDNTRANRQGADINRSFEEDGVAEVRLIKDLLQGQQIDCFIDLHEDWEAKGFYLYEGRRNKNWIGADIISAVEAIGPIDADGDIGGEEDNEDDSNEPISRGAFAVAATWGTVGLAPYVLEYHAPHVLIFETPTSWEIDRRVAAHLAALKSVLAHYS